MSSAHAEPRLARVAAAIADPTRARTLLRLLDGRMYTAGELARHAGVTAGTMSSHLKLLVAEGFARVRQQGRHRYFSLSDGTVAQALESLMRVADGLAHEPAADLKRWQQPAMRGLRYARSCYGHLAGELGVRLHAALLARGWVQAETQGEGRPGYVLSDAGRAGLTALGLAPATSGPRTLYGCVDWSERCEHFAGSLALQWLDAFVERDWLRRSEGSRELSITPSGQRALLDGLLRTD